MTEWSCRKFLFAVPHLESSTFVALVALKGTHSLLLFLVTFPNPIALQISSLNALKTIKSEL